MGSNSGTIRSSYTVSALQIDSNTFDGAVGGLVGLNEESNAISNSYWLGDDSSQLKGVGNSNVNVAMKLTAKQLQSPVEYSGIFADWPTDLDNADEDYDETTGIEDMWDFGTPKENPILKVDFNQDGLATSQEFGEQPRTVPTYASSETIRPETAETLATPTQTPRVVVVVGTATPSADALSGGGCNSVGVVPVGVGAANLVLLLAPLGVIGGVRWGRKQTEFKALRHATDGFDLI